MTNTEVPWNNIISAFQVLTIHHNVEISKAIEIITLFRSVYNIVIKEKQGVIFASNKQEKIKDQNRSIYEYLKETDNLYEAIDKYETLLQDAVPANFMEDYELRIKYKNNVDMALRHSELIQYDEMTIKQKAVVMDLLMHKVNYKESIKALNEANKYGRDITRMKRASQKLIKACETN